MIDCKCNNGDLAGVGVVQRSHRHAFLTDSDLRPKALLFELQSDDAKPAAADG